jgi:hypothetical protein
MVFVVVLLSMAVAATADDDNMQRASGSARITFTLGAVVVDRYEFSAVRHNDGRVTGNFNFRSRFSNVEVRARGDVLCVAVNGNRARIGGIVRQSDFEEGIPVGSQFLWSVTDNGEGSNDEPDTASPLLGTADAASYCAAGAPPPEFPSGRGNIQVKP